VLRAASEQADWQTCEWCAGMGWFRAMCCARCDGSGWRPSRDARRATPVSSLQA
jgi:DnaJ-class molecular chaperone